MLVISQQPLMAFWRKHGPAETPLRLWFDTVSAAQWKNFQDVKAIYSSADRAGQFTIFNIGGNKWRLIARIHYNAGTVYVRHVFTHSEYDAWTKALRKGKVK